MPIGLGRIEPRLSLVVILASFLLLTGCVGRPVGAGSSDSLHLVGFATSAEANKAAQLAWASTPAGEQVTWEQSFGASGEQSRAVLNGLPADYVTFSLESDVTRLVEAGLVDPAWQDGPAQGNVSGSVVAIAVAEGNPKGITGWADLIKPGVRIVTPNPASSGSARWNILAAYQQVISAGGTEEQAEEYLTKFFDNVVALPGSGRDATTAFLRGTADVLILYENEAILARAAGERFDYFVPDDTLKIEIPGAVLRDADPKARDYLEFILSPAGQLALAGQGFRPVLPDVDVGEVPGAADPANPFPSPKRLFTVDDDLGGWPRVNARFFAEDTGLVPRIQAKPGRQP